MDAIKPQGLDYYETMLRIAETQGIKIEVKPGEMRAFIAAAKAMAEADRIVRTINEGEVRSVRTAGAPKGVHVPEIRAAFARLRTLQRRILSAHTPPLSHAPHAKCGIRATVSGGRIPLSPPIHSNKYMI